MSLPPDPAWVRRTEHHLSPDPTRVVSKIFLPGQELVAFGVSRSAVVLDRVLALSEAAVADELGLLVDAYGHRHRDLAATWSANFELMRHRLPDGHQLSADRQLLVGAYFTTEFSIEGAAFFNPSMAPHPDQSGLPAGATRIVMTLRAVGEGHISSIELRTGVIDADDVLVLDEPPSFAIRPTEAVATYSSAAFTHQFDDLAVGRSNADFVLAALPPVFTRTQLDLALGELRDQRLTRGVAARTIERFELVASCTYHVVFPADSPMQERVLMPRAPSESHGMEDVRLVRFVDDDGSVEYLGTYTGYDGRRISMQMLRTRDFADFSMSPLSGPGARDKGLAVFPRRVGGRYLAMSRADRETNAVATSSDLSNWEALVPVQVPTQPWEIVQLGNCGPPIETEEGWLVLTHGVGPMRRYGIGALLLDLDDPTVVRGCLDQPLLTPIEDDRSGYVPNVVYSCGSMLHGRTVVLPYGASDSSARIALVDLDGLLGALTAS